MRPIQFRTSTSTPEKNECECLITLCAHDFPEFLHHQLRNINAHVPSCTIIVHINSEVMVLDENQFPDNVWINPEHIVTERSTIGLLQGFVSNIQYGYKKAIFKRVLFLSSSCFFFRAVDWTILPPDFVCCSPCEMSINMVISEPWVSCIWKDETVMT